MNWRATLLAAMQFLLWIISIFWRSIRNSALYCWNLLPSWQATRLQLAVMSAIFADAFIAVCLILFGLFVPLFLVLLNWPAPVPDLLSIIPSANESKRLSDILLIIIPVGTISYLAAFVFGFRGERTLWPALFIPCLFIPAMALTASQIGLYCCLFAYKEQVLSDHALFWASVAVYCSLTCVILLEIYVTVSRTLARR